MASWYNLYLCLAFLNKFHFFLVQKLEIFGLGGNWTIEIQFWELTKLSNFIANCVFGCFQLFQLLMLMVRYALKRLIEILHVCYRFFVWELGGKWIFKIQLMMLTYSLKRLNFFMFLIVFLVWEGIQSIIEIQFGVTVRFLIWKLNFRTVHAS